jgi:hypothetical protein
MLPLDHIPFYDVDPLELGKGFARLGFTLSPPSVYTAPDHPDAGWEGCCIFTRDGWLDLLEDEFPKLPGAPMSALFRTPDLAAARDELAVLNPQAAFRLERRWASDQGLPPERFAYAELRSRIAPLVLAVIEHPWPCHDLKPEWQDHANGALAIQSLIFGGEAPGPAAAAAARFLDPTALEYWPAAEFDAAFPGTKARRAIRVQVDDLAVTRRVLETAGARFAETAHGLSAPAQFGVEAGLLFSA